MDMLRIEVEKTPMQVMKVTRNRLAMKSIPRINMETAIKCAMWNMPSNKV